jgi:hypothetical protein
MFEPIPNNQITNPLYKALIIGIFLFFNQKTSAVTYYINDNSIVGDIYTNAVGNDANDGLTPSSPKLSIDTVYKIANEGDIIYVDTGMYPKTQLVILQENKRKIHFIMAPSKGELLDKRSLPATNKTNPAEFYIENDKPVDRSVYLQQKRIEGKKS